MTKMNEKLAARSTRVEACLGKETFHSPGSASRAAKNINRRRGNGAVRYYKCYHCGKWHIGGTRPATIALRVRRQLGEIDETVQQLGDAHEMGSDLVRYFRHSLSGVRD